MYDVLQMEKSVLWRLFGDAIKKLSNKKYIIKTTSQKFRFQAPAPY